MTTNDDKKKLLAWSETAGEETAEPGMSKEMIRKAMSLNPSLRHAGMNSTEALAALQKGSAQKSEQQAKEIRGEVATAPTAVPSKDFLVGIKGVKDRHAAMLKQIAEQEAKLQKDKKVIAERSLAEAIQLVIDIDPNMVSPRTLVVLDKEKDFLKTIGFTATKVVEQQEKKR